MWWIAFLHLFGTVLVPPCSHGLGGARLVYGSMDRYFEKARSMDLAHRVEFWSSLMKGTPYTLDPLGESDATDPDPLFDPCHVDCETFVEQVLALSFSENMAQTRAWLRAMRYHGCTVKSSHRYFTMAGSWIPGNMALGYLSPIKSLKIKEMKRFVRPEGRWREPFKSRLVAMGELAPRGWQRIGYVPLDWIWEQRHVLEKHVPAMGMIVAVKQLGNPFMVTHMGLLLRVNGSLVFRHASSLHHHVMDVPLRQYVDFLRTYEKEGYRPVAGMAFFAIEKPGIMPCRGRGSGSSQ